MCEWDVLVHCLFLKLIALKNSFKPAFTMVKYLMCGSYVLLQIIKNTRQVLCEGKVHVVDTKIPSVSGRKWSNWF